jgi:hypothetical protein
MIRPTPRPKQIYQHYLGSLVIIYGIAQYKAVQEPLDCPLYSILSPESEQEVGILLGLDMRLIHYQSELAPELVIYSDAENFQCCSVAYFNAILGKGNSTHYYRYNLISDTEQAQSIYQLVERYNSITDYESWNQTEDDRKNKPGDETRNTTPRTFHHCDRDSQIIRG